MKMTKEKFQYLLDNWEDKTTEEVAQTLEVSQQTLYQWASDFRKAGGYLPRKSGEGPNLKHEIIEEALMTNPDKRIDSLSKEQRIDYMKQFPKLFKK